MPNSIPYDHPSLVLGNIVDTQVLEVLKKIEVAQNSTEAAQQKMNSFIAMKRSVAMTINELMNINLDISDLQKEIKTIDISISQSAQSYIAERIKNETSIQKLKEQLSQLELNETLESPVDYGKSSI